MNWCLSPRWRLQDNAQQLLVGPDNQRLILEPHQYEAIRSRKLLLSPFAYSKEFMEIFTWAKLLIASRTLVPEYLTRDLSEESTAEDFYLEVFQVLCRHLAIPDLLPDLQAGILSWSGSVLKQPPGAPRDYLPSRPALCIDLLGAKRRSVRIVLDCREPLYTPWENILFARRTFERHLHYRTDLFNRMCELVFQEPSHFTNPRVKYLHPAIEYLPGGEEISAYWNMGNAENRQELWDRSLAILAAMGGCIQSHLNFNEIFGAFSQPELIGHTFDPRRPPGLKIYVMFDGLNRDILSNILELEKVLLPGAPVLEVLRWLEHNGLQPGRNLGIASFYHILGSRARAGIKIHLNLRDGFERSFGLSEIVGMVSTNIGEARPVLNTFPDRVVLGDGRLVELSPNTLSFMLLPEAGLTKLTVYVSFLE